MPALKITPDQLEKAVSLQRKGWTNGRIADELGVHRHTIGRALARYNARVYDRLVKRTAGEKGRQLAVLESVVEEALEQWERSKGDTITVKDATGVDGNGPWTETITTTRGNVGDPRLLAEAQKALAERRRILGIDKEGPDDSGDDPLIVAEMVKAQYAPEDADA